MSTRYIVVADGATKDFSVPFPYLSTADVEVYLNGALQAPSAYSWLSAGGISFPDFVARNTVVRIQRKSPAAPIVEYTTGSVLPLADLDRDSRQALYRVEELEARFNDTSLRLADDYPGATFPNTALPAPTPLALIGWDESAAGMRNFDPSEFVAAVTAGAPYVLSVSAGQTIVDASVIVAPWYPQAVYYNGIYQEPSAWAYSGGNIVFAEELPADGNVAIVAMLAGPGQLNDADLVPYTAQFAGAQSRSVRDKLGDTVSVKDFGAKGDGVTDDTAAINAAFDWIRAFPVTDPPASRPIRLIGHGGTYRVTQSINGTGIALGRSWELDGLTLVGECAGKTVLDLSGMRFGKLRNVRIYGSQTSQPHTGILLSNIDSAHPCSNNTFESVSIDGYFTGSALHLRSAEINRFNACDFWNRRAPDGGGESWAVILDGAGYKDRVSDYQTLAAGISSFTVNVFNGCTIQKPFGIDGPTMFMQDVASLSFNSCYLTNGGGSGIVWRLTGDLIPYRVNMDFQQETTDTDRFIQFTSDAAAAREVRGLNCTFGNSFVDGEIFSYDTLTSLTLKSFKCHLYRLASGVSMANGLFNPSSGVTIHDGDIVVPAFSDFDGENAFAGFNGKVSSMDGKIVTYGGNGVRVLAQSAVAVSHTGDTNETTLATVTVPARSVGKNGRLRISTTWSMTNNANGKGMRVRFGGTLLNSQTGASSSSARYVTEVANRNSESSQVGNSNGLIGIGNSGLAVVTTTIDTTVDQDIQIQCLLANAGDTATLESYVVELIRGE